MRMRAMLGLLSLLASATWSQAQTYSLTETRRVGETVRVELTTSVRSTMKVTSEGQTQAIPVRADGTHTFVQKTLATDKELATKVARFYETAKSEMLIGSEKLARTLRDDRRLIVAQKSPEGVTTFSPTGALNRDELDLVGEHFDTLYLAGILPNRDVKGDEIWKLGNPTVQALCLFDGLISHEMSGKVEEVKDGLAVLRITGPATGTEAGAMVRVQVDAKVSYDLLRKRILAIEWAQNDNRDLSPISPAMNSNITVTLKRTFLDEEPATLTSAALISVPTTDKVPEGMRQLQHIDPKGRYRFLYPREWTITGQTGNHLVMRLLDRGDFVAQATVSTWTKAAPGKHLTPDELKKLIGAQPGMELEGFLDEAEVPTDAGKWIYRITAKGVLNDIPVVQTFYAVAGPEGDQVVLFFTMKPGNVVKIGTHDVALVNSLEFTK
ncbi:hypothetical protein [Tuwongella immobilis]|uniref:DUF4412 domain-containing protein n=1 Tax=Tuwongella immobilis TaxID=692036 RepID=A0A6C2YJ03_9BACT|nr:hypothetical protein [Tuwongella immobilis]VIP01344.1 Uncharacterized protein OS=Planctomyces maris DSM 8797 GN=PM8797T_17524 PE=4 SV=1 [Tuwongella immobilis]VTR98125.1 Uncharacterized protein OS=Planctomyces maris DSM 8797 GN=PM8797T_17524 PE=4 SV=1 [Tuwongella immobilis]